MKLPPLHTALLSAANLLSFGGVTVAQYLRKMSSCSRRPVVGSAKITPSFSRSARALEDVVFRSSETPLIVLQIDADVRFGAHVAPSVQSLWVRAGVPAPASQATCPACPSRSRGYTVNPDYSARI